jgi:hypothetical protein
MLHLNDPLDCRPRLTNVPAPQTATDLHAAAFERDFLEKFQIEIGILCFSKYIEEPLLWSHYADSHRGIALGFEYTELPTTFAKIVYRPDNTRAELDYEEARNSLDDEDRLIGTLKSSFTTKASSWLYEQEYRQFVKLRRSGEPRCSMTGSHYFTAIPAKNLRQVILGANCPYHERDVSGIFTTGFHDSQWKEDGYPQMCRAMVQPHSYNLKIVPVECGFPTQALPDPNDRC